jgi:hypothetical protein
MDLIQYQRDVNMQKQHVEALRSIKPLTDSSKPSSMNYTHLAKRAKKKQMTDDRNYEIAMENRKLMVKMTEVSPCHISLEGFPHTNFAMADPCESTKEKQISIEVYILCFQSHRNIP